MRETGDTLCPNCHEPCFDRFLLEWGKADDSIEHGKLGNTEPDNSLDKILNPKAIESLKHGKVLDKLAFTGSCPFCQDKLQVTFLTFRDELWEKSVTIRRVFS